MGGLSGLSQSMNVGIKTTKSECDTYEPFRDLELFNFQLLICA